MLAAMLRGTRPHLAAARGFSSLVIKEANTVLPGAACGQPHTELLGRKAFIFQRPKNSMTSGTAATEGWLLEFEHTGHWYNPLMGYTSTADPVGTLRMLFDSEKAAVAFAERQGLAYSVEQPHIRRKFPSKSFEGNFKWKCVLHLWCYFLVRLIFRSYRTIIIACLL